MASSAIQIMAQVYRQLNLTEPTSFASGQEFPLNIALDVLNKVIREMNRLGNLWFMETTTKLHYTANVGTYNLPGAYAVDPHRIRYIRKEDPLHVGELREYNKRDFLRLFRSRSVPTGEPSAFTKYGGILELDVIPQQDYQITVYHFCDMPLVKNPTDTFLIPERDEDILIENCAHLLSARIGKCDAMTALQLIRLNTQPFLIQMKSDAGKAYQMPALF